MKFKYIDYDGPEVTKAHGVDFVRDVYSEVTDSKAIAFFTRHPHFEAEPVEQSEIAFNEFMDVAEMPCADVVTPPVKIKGKPGRKPKIIQ